MAFIELERLSLLVQLYPLHGLWNVWDLHTDGLQCELSGTAGFGQRDSRRIEIMPIRVNGLRNGGRGTM